MATINDVVLIYLEDTPVSFARVESILPDRKKDWYQIKLLMLQIPLQVVTWILRDVYINGDEFTMNGKKMRLEKVECPVEEMPVPEPEPRESESDRSESGEAEKTEESPGRIISFAELKKKNHDKDPG